MGLARQAARKLVPVVLTLGSGPSGFPRKLSARRPKLPRQPWQTRAVVRARSVIAALGAGPSGFPKQFRGDGRSFRDSHGKPAPSFAHAPLFWRWGLARRASRNNFPLALASVVLALGSGRTGFPRQVSERCKAGGSWTCWCTPGTGETRGPWRLAQELRPIFLRRGICGPKPMSQNGQPRLSSARTGQWPHYQPEADKWPDL